MTVRLLLCALLGAAALFGQSAPIMITTSSLPDATVGMAYSQQLTAAPTSEPQWSVVQGMLPPELALSPLGLISGTPTSVGSYVFVVRVTDSQYGTAQKQFTISVQPGIMISTSRLPDATVGVPYSQQLMAAPTSQPQWSLVQGTLPPGITLSPQGLISGTATSVAAYVFVVQITDPAYGSAQKQLTLNVQPGPPAITTSQLGDGAVGAAYSQKLSATGGSPPYTWSLSGGGLPGGLQLDAASGTISGTPTASGTFNFTITVSDTAGRTGSKGLSIVVAAAAAPTITTSQLAGGTVGVPYSQTLAAAGGSAPYTWAIGGGALPAGLQLDAASGTISGTPAAAGTFSFTVTVTDAAKRTASKVFSIVVVDTLTITTSALDGIVGVAFTETLAAAGGTPPYSWTISSGSLPRGLQLDSSTGRITGTPADAGTSNFIATVTDSARRTASKALVFVVADPLSITTPQLTASAGVAFTATLAATGGTPPYNWSISGTLPSGLTFNAQTGEILGTPATPGTSRVTVTVTDARKLTASKVFDFVVSLPAPPPVTLGGVGDTSPPARQPALTLALASPYPLDIGGTLSLAFASAVGGEDQMIQFVTGGRTVNFTIPAGSTQAAFGAAQNVAVQTGTVAGTITLSVTLRAAGVDITPSPQVVRTIAIDQLAPVLTRVDLIRSSNSIVVQVTGHSTTRNMVRGTFRFTPTQGSTIQNAEITVPLDAAFLAWYRDAQSNAFGSQFTLMMPFTVTGRLDSIASVTVVLSNSRGDSAPGTPP